MKQHPLIDGLDEIQQRVDAQTSMVPTKGVPPAEVPRHEGPPGRSQEAPAFFCGTGASLPELQKSANQKSNLTKSCVGCAGPLDDRGYCPCCGWLIQDWDCYMRWGNLAPAPLPKSNVSPDETRWVEADPRLAPLLGQQKSPGQKSDSHSRYLRLGVPCERCGQVPAGIAGICACLPAPENPETRNPTVSRYETGCYYCGSPIPAGRIYCCDACLTIPQPTEPYETNDEWVERAGGGSAPEPWPGCWEFVEAEVRRWFPLYLVADGHEAPLDYSFLLPGMRKTVIGPAPTNLAAKVEARRRVANSWADHLEAIGASMSPEYRRTVEGPDYVPPIGGVHVSARRDPEKALMMPGTVAGHTFEGVGSDARCGCGRYWVDIKDCHEGNVGQGGLAHTGDLSSHELKQIEERRAAEERFWEAVAGVSSGR